MVGRGGVGSLVPLTQGLEARLQPEGVNGGPGGLKLQDVFRDRQLRRRAFLLHAVGVCVCLSCGWVGGWVGGQVVVCVGKEEEVKSWAGSVCPALLVLGLVRLHLGAVRVLGALAVVLAVVVAGGGVESGRRGWGGGGFTHFELFLHETIAEEDVASLHCTSGFGALTHEGLRVPSWCTGSH